jgi:hypothetical protein
MTVALTLLIMILIAAVAYPAGRRLGSREPAGADAADRTKTSRWASQTMGVGAVGTVAIVAWVVWDSQDAGVLVAIVALLTAIQVALTWQRLRQPARRR